jgi:hypothetical protein
VRSPINDAAERDGRLVESSGEVMNRRATARVKSWTRTELRLCWGRCRPWAAKCSFVCERSHYLLLFSEPRSFGPQPPLGAPGELAQLGAQQRGTLKVKGSSPLFSIGELVQLGASWCRKPLIRVRVPYSPLQGL